MKFMIWFLCSLLYAIIVTTLSFAGITLGGLPTILLLVLTSWLAKHWCKRVEGKSFPKVNWEKVKSNLQRYRAPWPIIVVLVLFLLLAVIQSSMFHSEIKTLETEIEKMNLQYESELQSKIEDAKTSSYNEGYRAGYIAGKKDGIHSGYSEGYDDGKDDSEDLSYYEGFVYGYSGASADYGGAEVLSILTEIIKSCDSIEEVYESFVERRMLIFGRGDPGRE